MLHVSCDICLFWWCTDFFLSCLCPLLSLLVARVVLWWCAVPVQTPTLVMLLVVTVLTLIVVVMVVAVVAWTAEVELGGGAVAAGVVLDATKPRDAACPRRHFAQKTTRFTTYATPFQFND